MSGVHAGGDAKLLIKFAWPNAKLTASCCKSSAKFLKNLTCQDAIASTVFFGGHEMAASLRFHTAPRNVASEHVHKCCTGHCVCIFF